MILTPLVILLSSAAPSGPQTAALPRALAPADSARAEMRTGRPWHASRILRSAGAHRSEDPVLRLLLVEAEAGWKNWAEVVRLLDGTPGQAVFEVTPDAWLLLGRAREEEGSWATAAAAYSAFLGRVQDDDPRRPAVLARLARAQLNSGRLQAAVATLAGVPVQAEPVRSWAAVAGAESRGAVGDTAAVTALLSLVRDATARQWGWRILPRARLAAGDTAGAYRAYLAERDGAHGERNSDAAGEAGSLALALRDSASARSLLEEGIRGPSGVGRARAAAALLGFPDTGLLLTLRIAEQLDRGGDPTLPLRAYDRATGLARAQGVHLGDSVRLARARLMALVPARHLEASEEFSALQAGTSDPRVGARALDLLAALRRRQGRGADAAVLGDQLLAAYPASTEAAELRWSRAREREVAGDLAGALPLFEAYLADFPTGRRWEEASFWAAFVRHRQGDVEGARRVASRLLRDEPLTYHAVMASDLLGQPYRPVLPQGEPAPVPSWLAAALVRLELLEAAGLSTAADAEEAQAAERARGEEGALLAMAEALIRRGRTLSGINLAMEVRRGGRAWDRRLAEAAFPYPFREMVEHEAREWGVDPILVAAVIRQESAFETDIVSPAGAVGLMQVMPATGRELAGRHGPAGLRDDHLKAPDVNVHLGTAYLRDLVRRYDRHLPLVLAAYNAGPGRANRWRELPEVADAVRFTERIPFEETRGYVRLVRRNMAVYRWLYGSD